MRRVARGLPKRRTRLESLESRWVLSSVLVPAGATWNFLTTVDDAPDGWQAPAFDDSSWESGPAEIGYGDTVMDNRPEVTHAEPSVPTVYFRHAFEVADPAQIAALSLALLRDDGAAVYLNGVEVVRDNIPPGATFWTQPLRLVSGFEERQWLHFPNVSPSLLVQGTNVLAVEVHSSNSAEFYVDLSFDLSLQVPDVQSIAAGQSGSGTIAEVGEFDVWQFSAQEGDYVAMDVDQAATDGNLEWTLRAPDGSMLYYPPLVDNQFIGDLYTLRIPATGVYTLEFSDNAGGTGSYRFDLLDIATPTPIPLAFGELAEGSVESFGELDHWQLTLPAGRRIFFDYLELSAADPNAQVFFKLLDPSGQYINGRTVRPGESQENADMAFALSAAGAYTLEVLNESAAPVSYRFQMFDVTDPDLQDIAIGQIVDGAVDTPGGFDAFRLNVSGSPRVFVDVRQQSGGVLDWRLKNPGGTTVLSATGSGEDPNGGDLGAVVLDAAGIWTIEVDGRGDDTGTYQFQVLAVPEPDVFTLALGAVAEGAIEAPGASDRWSVTIPAQTRVYLDVQAISAGRLHFRRLNVNGVLQSSTGDASDPDLADKLHSTSSSSPRSYTFEVDGDRDAVASYRFQLFAVHDDALAGGVGSELAGNVETPGSSDQWTLSVAAGQEVFFDVREIGGSGQRLSFRLLRNSPFVSSFPQVVVDAQASSGQPDEADRGPVYLLAGDYTLTVAGLGDDTAAYRLLLRPTAAQPDTLISNGEVWRYLDDGSDQGTEWIGEAFDDSNWPSGPAKLGYGNQTEVTYLSYVAPDSSGIATYYFRRSFAVTDPAAYRELSLLLMRDDGVAVYVNGHEVHREFLPAGADYQTRASMAAPDDGETFNLVAGVSPQWLHAGMNTVAVEIHNVSVPGADIGFDLALVAHPLASVAGRHLFYNNSAWDGNDPAAAASDDAAIATDKSALLPGQTAAFANYSSYARGMNGLMIDVAGLPAGDLTAADFRFRVGNDNAPQSWADAPAPSAVSVRRGAGVGGTDRATIVWPDGAIKKQWLQVTLLSGAASGLAADDVFYFGNAVGEVGNSTTDAVVNAADELAARVHPRHPLNPAPIDYIWDFNRDKLVNANDQILARVNATNPLTALRLIAIPAAAGEGAAAEAPLSTLGGLDVRAPRRRRR